MKLNDKVLDKVIGGANTTTQSTAGMNCPACGEFIPISIEQIISGKTIFCKSCGLTLEIETTRSKRAIDAMRKVREAQEALERRQQAQ